MAKELSVHKLRESEFDEWDNFADSVPAGGVYSLARYLELLCSCTGGAFTIVAARKPDGAIAGGVALFEPRGKYRTVSNRLLLYYNGIVLAPSASSYPSERTATELETLGALENYLGAGRYASILLHNRVHADWRVFQERGWHVEPGYTYEVPLDSLTNVWARIEKNLRRLVNRATDAGYSVRAENDFDSFYQLHAGVSERKDAPLYLPQQVFRRFVGILEHQGLGRLYLARASNGDCAAAQLVLTSRHPMTHTVCAGSAPDHLKAGVNPLLRWRAFEMLAQDGFKGNDLTDAALNPVTHFKSQLGGTLTPTVLVSKTFSRRYRMHLRTRSFRRGVRRGIKKLLLRP